jgi:methionyl-tRNA synthetase
VEVPYYLTRYHPDALRFRPTKTRDTEFSWQDLLERNNPVLSVAEGSEMVATWGNLINRMRSFAYKRFDGAVPEPGDPSSSSGQVTRAHLRLLPGMM